MKLSFYSHRIVEYFEHGDLVPFIILVSAIHYTAILREHDYFVAAVSIGCLVDLGHYRWVKAAVRYAGENRSEKVARWFMVVVMSAIALNYQQRFYNDWWLSIPMPLLIASLAWLNQKDKHTGERSKLRTVEKSENKTEKSENKTEKSGKNSNHFDWRTLSENDRNLISSMSTSELTEAYGISDRTARNWRKAAVGSQLPSNGKGHVQ